MRLALRAVETVAEGVGALKALIVPVADEAAVVKAARTEAAFLAAERGAAEIVVAQLGLPAICPAGPEGAASPHGGPQTLLRVKLPHQGRGLVRSDGSRGSEAAGPHSQGGKTW